jgi:hypothetical protein
MGKNGGTFSQEARVPRMKGDRLRPSLGRPLRSRGAGSEWPGHRPRDPARHRLRPPREQLVSTG